MVVFDCPLCCTATFDTPAALKTHVDGILKNLTCPFCDHHFPIENFLDHLEACIEEVENNSVSESADECLEQGESILARALLKGSKEKNEAETAEYYCQSCDANFKDIDTHLGQFHQGQEIILEEEEESTSPASSFDQSLFVLVNPSEKQKPVTEDVKDKDGRLYTRKFVKIDKFWDKQMPDVNDAKLIDVTLCTSCDNYYPADANHTCEESKQKHICEICNTPFPTFKSLRLHKRMHEPIRSHKIEAPANYEGDDPVRQMFICKICHKTYDKEYEQVHMTSHDCNNGFICEVCNRKFFTESNLEMHMKAHSNFKKFTCSYCKKPFVTYDALNDHLSNQCQKSRPYVCQYCGRRFTRPHEKVKHERIHTGEKPHVCEICGKAFRVSYCLTLHLRTHSGTRPYQCTHCGKRFKSHSVYNHHMLIHSEVRAYKCPFCPKAFKTSVQLAGHKNSHIKPFTCTECNRPFSSLYAVRAHMETHKRENNLKYECWMCGALYSRAFALRDHLKQQHQQAEGEKAKTEVVGIDEEMEAANSILVNEEDIILGLEEATNIEIIDGRE